PECLAERTALAPYHLEEEIGRAGLITIQDGRRQQVERAIGHGALLGLSVARTIPPLSTLMNLVKRGGAGGGRLVVSGGRASWRAVVAALVRRGRASRRRSDLLAPPPCMSDRRPSDKLSRVKVGGSPAPRHPLGLPRPSPSSGDGGSQRAPRRTSSGDRRAMRAAARHDQPPAPRRLPVSRASS